MTKKTYVVYLHVKKGTKYVFYVGIGSKRRAYTNNKRNKGWYEIVEKYGYDVIIINKVNNYGDAILIESELIECFGRVGFESGGRLVNIALTPSSTFEGRKHTEKTRKIMSTKAFNRKSHNHKVSWYGKTYKSLRDCSRKESVPFSTVQKYVNWVSKPNCFKIEKQP